MVDEGRLPAYKFGRVFRFKQADLEAVVEAQRIKPGGLANLYPGGRGRRARELRARPR
jgi:hypothetical protein